MLVAPIAACIYLLISGPYWNQRKNEELNFLNDVMKDLSNSPLGITIGMVVSVFSVFVWPLLLFIAVVYFVVSFLFKMRNKVEINYKKSSESEKK